MLFFVLFTIVTIHTCFIVSNLFLFLVIHKATLHNTLTRNHLNDLSITNCLLNFIGKLYTLQSPFNLWSFYIRAYAGSVLRAVNNFHWKFWRVGVRTSVSLWYFLRATKTIFVIPHCFFSIRMNEITIRLNLDKVKGTHTKYEMQ